MHRLPYLDNTSYLVGFLISSSASPVTSRCKRLTRRATSATSQANYASKAALHLYIVSTLTVRYYLCNIGRKAFAYRLLGKFLDHLRGVDLCVANQKALPTYNSGAICYGIAIQDLIITGGPKFQANPIAQYI